MGVPISLIIDDGAPVNPAYWLHPDQENVMLVPNDFTDDFADFCVKRGVRGKFSVLPCPSGAGRIDQSISFLSDKHLRGFLEICRQKIRPQFDITPEIMTHQRVVDVKSGSLRHWFEDEWVARATVDEITDYIACALRILKKVGLPANGVTSPWATGNRNEREYAQSIGQAHWRVHRRRMSWYFLHVNGRGSPKWPSVTYRDHQGRYLVVSVPANTGDPFWGSQGHRSKRAGLDAVRPALDAMLSRDGKSGRLRELYEAGGPMVLLTHWQSLFSNDSRAGLAAFKELVRRIDRAFGDDVEWVTCSELARRAVRRERAGPS